MTLQEAEHLRMPFGKYRGRTLGEIADRDVLYLDWLNDPERKVRSPDLLLAIGLICADRSNEIDAKVFD